MLFDRILVVCTGNICRSPMGEGQLKAHLTAAGKPQSVVESAGTAALIGYPADEKAIAAAAVKNIDISGHRAKQCSTQMITDFQLILVMEETQKRWVEKLHPAARGRVSLFTRFTNSQEVADPYGADQKMFHEIFDLMDKNAQAWVKVIAQR